MIGTSYSLVYVSDIVISSKETVFKGVLICGPYKKVIGYFLQE